LKTLLEANNYDAIICAAAVSDFSVASVSSDQSGRLNKPMGKLASDSELLLRLKPNPKLLNKIKEWSKNPKIRVIGFKLTDTEDQDQRFAAVKKQFDESKVDAVVHNDLSDIRQKAHSFCLHTPMQKPVFCENGEALAITINKLVETV